MVFKAAEPILRAKQHDLDIQDCRGLLEVRLTLGRLPVFHTVFTRIDQVFLGWGLLCAVIFAAGQWTALDWGIQALWGTALSGIVSLWMGYCTWMWAKAERVEWLVLGWVGLMGLGLLLTDLSIVLGWEVMLRLGVLWLGLCALGYLGTGLALRSRALALSGAIHLVAAGAAFLVPEWQFLIAGSVLSTCLFLLGCTQWDMRPPIEYALDENERAFNRVQHRKRQESALQWLSWRHPLLRSNRPGGQVQPE